MNRKGRWVGLVREETERRAVVKDEDNKVAGRSL